MSCRSRVPANLRPGNKPQLSIIWKARWAPEQIWTFSQNKTNISLSRDWSRWLLARIQSLYPLSHPSFVLYLTQKCLLTALENRHVLTHPYTSSKLISRLTGTFSVALSATSCAGVAGNRRFTQVDYDPSGHLIATQCCDLSVAWGRLILYLLPDIQSKVMYCSELSAAS